MTKQEFIKSKWEEAGFIWEEIKFIVNPSGGLQLQHVAVKHSLTGYAEAHDKGLLKGYDFDGSGLKVWNKLLDGVEHNNGWTNIESEADLPERGLKYDYCINGETCFESESYKPVSGQILINMFYELAGANRITHYRQVKDEPKPLY